MIIAMRHLSTFLFAFALAALLPGEVFAQRGTLKADCIIQLKGTTGGQARLTVMPGTTPAYVLSPTDLHFVLDLPLDETYLITVEHPDCVTKQLYVDANVTVDQRTKDFDFPLKVVLEHHEQPFTYAGPVGFIYYEHGLTDFSYNTEYALTINSRFGERMAELQRTGVDPRSAFTGYTATTTPVAPVSAAPKEDDAMAQWSAVAPMVAHVGPMVHRLSREAGPATLPEQPVDLAPTMEVRVPAPPEIDPSMPLVVSPTTALLGLADVPDIIAVTAHREPGPASNEAKADRSTFTRELIVEEQRVTTIIRITHKDERVTEYRRVLHGSGAIYYFQNGRSISGYSYDTATERMMKVGGNMEREALDL